jgi:hypothetical protein
MYAGFKRIAPEQDTGMDLNEPWITALRLSNNQRSIFEPVSHMLFGQVTACLV